jgi:hypothetical protein
MEFREKKKRTQIAGLTNWGPPGTEACQWETTSPEATVFAVE